MPDDLPVVSDISEELRQFGVAGQVPAEAVGESIFRVRAYELWVKDGRPVTDGIKYWYEAKKQLNG